MNTFAIGSLPVHFSVAKLFNFRWQYTKFKTAKSGVIDLVLAVLKMHQYRNPNIQSGTWLSKTYSVLSLTT